MFSLDLPGFFRMFAQLRNYFDAFEWKLVASSVAVFVSLSFELCKASDLLLRYIYSILSFLL